MEKFANSAQTQINQIGGITAVSTAFTVTSSSLFPTPIFRIRVDNELMKVIGVAGNILTVERGSEGTIATPHPNGSLVTHVLTAGAIDQLKLEIGGITGPAGAQGLRVYRELPVMVLRVYRGLWGPLAPVVPPGLWGL